MLQFFLFFVPLWVIWGFVVFHYARKFSKRSGEPIWFFIRYAATEWFMDSKKYPLGWPDEVLAKGLEKEVGFIQHLNLVGMLIMIFYFAAVFYLFEQYYG